uniref:Uncharacterized protein n=1 Tax=Mycobacterium riyadhense TaxID=486698 RepID=A0A653F437_9MYCO|nr:hypothetical protein BIN_B_05313 [Mycobacterium riyadhense]
MIVLVARPHVVDTGARAWTRACRLDSLLPGRGVAMQLPDHERAPLLLLRDQAPARPASSLRSAGR